MRQARQSDRELAFVRAEQDNLMELAEVSQMEATREKLLMTSLEQELYSMSQGRADSRDSSPMGGKQRISREI